MVSLVRGFATDEERDPIFENTYSSLMLHDYRCIVGKDLFRTQGDLWLQSTLLGSISDILGIQGGVLDAKVYQLNKTNKTVIHTYIYILIL